MKIVKKALKPAWKFLRAGICGDNFYVYHIDAKGKTKVFACDTFSEALEWTTCALNCDKVLVKTWQNKIVDTRSSVV